MSGSTADCTSVSTLCPVEATTYGYYPALGPNAALLAVFALLLLSQLALGALRRVYAYSLAIAAGCLLEVVGYAGRLIMNDNPWHETGTRMQIICLILGPSFIAGGIYFTLKHFIRLNGPEYSWLPPNLYTWVFIGCDIGSILLQAAGGGIAASASADHDMDLLDVGNNVIIAGIAFQVATMVCCGVITIDYSIRRWRKRGAKPAATKGDRATQVKARFFQGSVALAYVTVLIRCIYRIPEMVGGWGNEMMRKEDQFLILDGLMIAIACATLTIFHPGFFYPYMRTGHIPARNGPVELSTPYSGSSEGVHGKPEPSRDQPGAFF